MASYDELSFDWNILFQDFDHWTKTDLQLAAELGKTLLERNKELETSIKHHQNIIEDQAQEIVYLQKQTAALREVNDSRLKIYEQLEVGIQDLERANHRLIVENTGDKKHIKTIVHNLETLESRVEELSKNLEDAKKSLAAERRKNERLQQDRNSTDSGETVASRLRPTNNLKPLNLNSDESHTEEQGFNANTTAPENLSFSFLTPTKNSANSTSISGTSGGEVSFNLSAVDGTHDVENEEIIRLVTDLEGTKKAFISEQQRCAELEEQLVAIIQENQTLQGRIAQTSNTEEMKSVHDELSILEEVRQGNMCSRCLRSCEDRVTANDEQSSIAPTEEEEDDQSLLGMDRVGDDSELSQAPAYRSTVSIKVASRPHPDSLDLDAPASPNPYRDLVEKYEALLEVQRHSFAARKSSNGPSLAEEFQTSGEFQNKTQKLLSQTHETCNGDRVNINCNGSTINEINAQSTETAISGEEETNKHLQTGRGPKSVNRRTPTEFSEAETSSSGFSDETSNKSTQTDDRSGFFLCSIGDGEDCKFTIYDDATPVDSHFRDRPEYRKLFKEIFAVLKKAAENKEEGEKLPLLDDTHPMARPTITANKVPPVTPANEELPVDFGCDDSQSIISSAISEQSFAMSECITKLERRTAKKHITEKNQENKPPLGGSIAESIAQDSKDVNEKARVMTPLKREPLEYLTVGVGIKKKNRRKNRNFSNDRSESPATLPSPPRFYFGSGKKRKDMRPFAQQSSGSSPSTSESPAAPHSLRKFEWNGNSMIIYNRGKHLPNNTQRNREVDLSGMEYRPSTVSQDLHKLKKLDLSYAEVLRRADCHHAGMGHHHRRK